ncbi:MAG: hypothetical protein WC586_01310 [Methanoregula sp.]
MIDLTGNDSGGSRYVTGFISAGTAPLDPNRETEGLVLPPETIRNCKFLWIIPKANQSFLSIDSFFSGTGKSGPVNASRT